MPVAQNKIVNDTYFFGARLLSTSQASLKDFINSHINNTIEQVLHDMLGVELGIAAYNGMTAESVDTKWAKLRDGEAFDLACGCGKSFHYGLAHATKKTGILVDYFYFDIVRLLADQTSDSGAFKEIPKGAIIVDSDGKQRLGWNAMVDKMQPLYDYLAAHKETYTEFDLCKTKSKNYLKKIWLF